jgi:hypothetical protein
MKTYIYWYTHTHTHLLFLEFVLERLIFLAELLGFQFVHTRLQLLIFLAELLGFQFVHTRLQLQLLERLIELLACRCGGCTREGLHQLGGGRALVCGRKATPENVGGGRVIWYNRHFVLTGDGHHDLLHRQARPRHFACNHFPADAGKSPDILCICIYIRVNIYIWIMYLYQM